MNKYLGKAANVISNDWARDKKKVINIQRNRMADEAITK